MSRKRKTDVQPDEATTTVAEPSSNGHAAVLEETPPVEHPDDHAAPNRPARSFSYPVASGVYIQSSCWPKEIQYDGRIITVFSVTVRKSYWHEDEKCWKNTTYFRSSELSIARHALLRAEEWCLDQRQSDVPF